MQSVDDFMHGFLVAERELRRRCAELETEFWHRFADPGRQPKDLVKRQKLWDEHTQVETFNEVNDSATVIASTVRPSQWLTRARYTLRQIEGGWRISKLEWSCKLCEGKGRRRDSAGARHECSICKGTGYLLTPEERP